MECVCVHSFTARRASLRASQSSGNGAGHWTRRKKRWAAGAAGPYLGTQQPSCPTRGHCHFHMFDRTVFLETSRVDPVHLFQGNVRGCVCCWSFLTEHGEDTLRKPAWGGRERWHAFSCDSDYGSSFRCHRHVVWIVSYRLYQNLGAKEHPDAHVLGRQGQEGDGPRAHHLEHSMLTPIQVHMPITV